MPDEEQSDSVADHVLDHYEAPYHQGDCPGTTHSPRCDSPMCGDWVRVDLKLSADDQIREAWFDGEGCVLSQAAASMLVEKIEGMSGEQVRQWSAAEMLRLYGPELSPSRQKCWLLPWRVVQ